MKLWHIVGGRPIGPTFEAYKEPFEFPEYDDEGLPWGYPYGLYVEETTLEQFLADFKKQVEYLPYGMRLQIEQTYKSRKRT